MGITITTSGSLSKTEAWLRRMKELKIQSTFNHYGELGVSALEMHTPVDSGETQHSWYYKVSNENGAYVLSWHNRHVVEGVPIAIILQYGHGTGTGGYVQGRDYINPAIKPIFEQIRNEIRKAVTSG